MKKRGFTLIELLAVIVVLAIITLVATPIVMNVIKNASKGAAERSAERYVDAVETAIATDRLENDLIEDGTYNIVDGQLEGTSLDIEVSGDYPKSGTVTIENGQVVSDGTSMTIGNYTVTIDESGKATAKEKGDALVLCTAATPTPQPLFDDSTAEMIPTVVGLQATEAAPYALGAEYTCDLGDGSRTFYVLKEYGDNVKLIMNENLGNPVNWCVSGENDACEAAETKASLVNRTSEWTKLFSENGTVELPTGQLIADVIGDESWNASNESWNGELTPNWLAVNLDGPNVPYGYWTSTICPNCYDATFNLAWSVLLGGDLAPFEVVTDVIGIRPVITISKSNMSL